MLVLMVAAFSSYPVPTILLNQLHDVSHLHEVTLSPGFQTVNTSQANWILQPGQYSIAVTVPQDRFEKELESWCSEKTVLAFLASVMCRNVFPISEALCGALPLS
jgi:hypothetical protein